MGIFSKAPRPYPSPYGPVPGPPRRTTTGGATGTVQPAAYTPAGAGGGTPGARGAGGYNEIVNPWQAALRANYEQSQARPYQANWMGAVGQASTLGNRDYEGDLRRFAQEDVQKQITSADNQLGAIGMRELALRPDVQADRAKALSDASTRAMIDSQGIKANALETMRGMLGSATGVELDRIGQMIQAANSGGGNYNEFTNMVIPLQEKMGLAQTQRKQQLEARNAENLAAQQEQTARREAERQRLAASRGSAWSIR